MKDCWSLTITGTEGRAIGARALWDLLPSLDPEWAHPNSVGQLPTPVPALVRVPRRRRHHQFICLHICAILLIYHNDTRRRQGIWHQASGVRPTARGATSTTTSPPMWSNCSSRGAAPRSTSMPPIRCRSRRFPSARPPATSLRRSLCRPTLACALPSSAEVSQSTSRARPPKTSPRSSSAH